MNLQVLPEWFRRRRTRPITLVILAVLAVAFTVIPAASSQDSGWFGSHFYQVVRTPMYWHGAVDYCAQNGAHLVTINSAAEDEFVYGLLPFTWLAATDEEVEGTWHWVTGEPFDYTNWAPNEPSNWSPNDQLPEHYLSYWGETYPGQWNDIPVNAQRWFVCEYEHYVSGHGRFNTEGNGQVTFTLSNEQVSFDRVRGERFSFTGDVESVTGSGNEATLTGTGTWNGTSGYSFEVSVADKGGWGRLTDTIEVVIRDPSGALVLTSFGPQVLKQGDIVVTPAN
jgi:hypothetical protein